ncbi:hypothetical protein GCM10025777_30160 [Membranihabitans marinus]
MIIGLLFVSCEKDDPIIPNEEELITTVVYTLVSDSAPTVTFEFKDLDGDGGNAPMITSGILQANTEYTGSLTLSNDSEDPSEDITSEITEEDDEHQFFFAVDGGLDLSIDYDDQDGDGNPIGLKTKATTGQAGTGNLTVTLRHEPTKSADGVSDGLIANAGGETDIEVTFIVTIE